MYTFFKNILWSSVMKNSIYITHLQNIILWKALCNLFLFLQKRDVWQFILGVDSLSAIYT